MNQCTTWHGTVIVAYKPMVYLWLEQDLTISVGDRGPHSDNVRFSGEVDEIGRDMIAVYESTGAIKTINEAKRIRLQQEGENHE